MIPHSHLANGRLFHHPSSPVGTPNIKPRWLKIRAQLQQRMFPMNNKTKKCIHFFYWYQSLTLEMPYSWNVGSIILNYFIIGINIMSMKCYYQTKRDFSMFCIESHASSFFICILSLFHPIWFIVVEIYNLAGIEFLILFHLLKFLLCRERVIFLF